MRSALNVLGRYAVIIVGFAGGVHAEEPPSATPYRPTVSTPANLSAPGWVELETGLQRVQDGSDTRRDSVVYTLKYALTEDWGVRLGGEGWVRQTDAGTALAGGGDTAVIVKYRFALTNAAALGLEAGANFPTARSGLGSRKTDHLITAILSADFAQLHTDLNVSATQLGSVDADESRRQFGAAAALSGPLDARWGWAVELSGTWRRKVPGTAQALGAVTFSPTRRVVFDAALALGGTPSTPDWSVMVGMTWLIGRLP